MEIPGSTSGIPQAVTGKPSGSPPAWQIGQQLQATVLENSTGKLLLAIGNRQVSAETSLPFDRGQALTLEVRNLGQQPVLRVISALQEPPNAMAVRLLLPRHGASTPLLASLAELARTPNAPVPPLIREVARTLVANLPTAGNVSTAQGVKTALQNSGLFLENRLLQTGSSSSTPVTIQSDYKANLIRLIQLVRNWPGSTQTPSPAPGKPATSATLPPPPSPAGAAPIGQNALAQSPDTGKPPLLRGLPVGAGTPALNQPPPALPSQTSPVGSPTPPPIPVAAAKNVATGTSATPPASTPPPAAGANTRTAQPNATPDQVQRAIQGTQTPQTTPARPGVTNTVLPPGGAPLANPTTTTAAAPGLNPPPPFAGVVPVAQTPVQASLDLINRLGNPRLDLLQQTEAALARVQLGQLAALPREGERGLIEWLFDLPVRRGDDTDLWSLRFYRDHEDPNDAQRQKTTATWSVQLAFDLPGLGPMQAQIQLHGEQVSTHFWATEQDTLPLLRESLHELRQALLDAGLEVGEVDCKAGRIADTPGHSGPPIFSEKA